MRWSGILSIRPRGRCRSSTPKGTQTRPAPESAERVVVRRMIRPVRKGCQSRAWGIVGCRPDRATALTLARRSGTRHPIVSRRMLAAYRGYRRADADATGLGADLQARAGLVARHARILPRGIAGLPCDGPTAGAILSEPIGAGTPTGGPGNPSHPGPGSAYRPVADGHFEIARVPPAPRRILSQRYPSTVTHNDRSHRTNGREAGLASGSW
jgi:hypothetical protein